MSLAAVEFIFTNNDSSSTWLENTGPVPGSCILRCPSDQTGHPWRAELCYLRKGGLRCENGWLGIVY